ncbi:MAG TPA: hypothetical protein VFV34_15195, partial [Blastocatellia bacterium]|nr:hypothetical protein [Blastocatellia bacterium]
MKNISRLLAGILALSSILAVSRAQEQAPRSETALPEKMQTVLAEIDQILELANTFSDEHLKVVVRSRAADTLWRIDEPRSRRLAIDNFKAIRVQGTGPAAIYIAASLERDILMKAAYRDPGLVDQMLALDSVKPDHDLDRWLSMRAETLLMAANVNQGTHPDWAARIAQDALDLQPSDYRVSREYSALLYRFQQRDRKLAERLFDHALTILGKNPEDLLANVGWIATYVLPDLLRQVPAGSPTPSLDPQQIRVLELVHDAVISASSVRGAINDRRTVAALIPYYERLAP